jgi:outer membrane receptor protein involved in Fe transport
MRYGLAIAALLLSTVASWAQVSTANLTGTVQDASGAVIPGAAVTLTNDAAGLTYNTETGPAGGFAFSVLPTGTYTLSVQSAGFKAYRSTGIRLVASANVRQVHSLEIGQVTETVEVAGAPPLVATQASEQTESIDNAKVSELPLGRRNVTSLLKLSSGIDTGSGGVRINGLGKSGAGVTVNGTDANSNPSEGRALENYGGRNYMDIMSIEGVEEVQIMRGVMKAENGGVVSGTVNLISKRGSNQWHGSAFENYRSEAFNARNPFQSNYDGDGRILDKNREVFNQYGGSIGGPIVKNKLFVFGLWEGYREYANQRVAGNTPTDAFRQTILQARPEPETTTNLATINSPNVLRDGDDYIGRWEGAGSRERTEDHFVVRGDYSPTPSSNLSFTYSRNRPFGLDPRFNTGNDNDRTYQYFQDRYTAQFTKTSSTWVSETRFGYNHADMDRLDRFFLHINPDFAETNPFMNRIPRFRVQTPTGNLNLNSAEIWFMEGSTTTIDQKISKIKGNHSFKFGGRMIVTDGNRGNPENPRYEFNSLDDMFSGQVNSTFNQFASGGPHRGRQTEIGGFVQDDWRATSKLMLNVGLRYDYYTKNVITPTSGVMTTNKNLETPIGGVGPDFAFGGRRPFDNPIENDGWVNLGPRAGFAYSANTKTVVRGGIGIMFAGNIPGILRQSTADPDIPRRLQFSRIENDRVGLKYPFTNEEARPLALAEIQNQGTELAYAVIDNNLQNPYTINYQLNIQRSITDTLMFEIGYVGVRGIKFPMHRRYNVPDRVTGIRPNPMVVPSGTYVSSDESVMNHSLQTSFRKRMSNNLSFDFHYTYGQTMAYAGGDVGLNYAADATDGNQTFFDLANERAAVQFDVKHRAVADVIYDLPTLQNLSAPLRAILGGWQVSTIYTGSTAEPILVRQGCSQGHACRPDYVGGSLYTTGSFGTARVGSHQDTRHLNPDAFTKIPEPFGGIAERPGNAGKSLARGIGAWNVDFNVSKSFEISESVRLQIRAEMFNVLNHVNLTSLNGNVENSDFGTFDSAQGMRNMQVGARLTF